MFRLLLLGLVFLATAATAQDRPRAILVLDASGSMWGQIDGKAKITIAQEVIGELLQTLPAEQVLGLTAYGHRRKGDCADIETIIAPEGDQRAAIGAAVNGFKPKGKTPMTDAVIAAAEALKYTEEAATVILVSDGVETCNPDPCAAARLLEETGVNFTAHVIGFDVGSDAAALAQMQCLAEETGGTFRSAANAAELGEALTVVAEPVMPEPNPFLTTFNAKDGPTGPTITSGLDWSVTDAAGAILVQGGADQTPSRELLPGSYRVSVLRETDGATGERDFTVEDTAQTVVLVLPELPPEPVRVRLFATDGQNGPRIGDELVWDLSGGETSISAEIAPNLDLRLVKGEYTVSVLRPADEASAEMRFGVGTIDKTVVLALPEFRPAATLDAPDSVPAGSLIQVRWTGPDQPNDRITVNEPSARRGVRLEVVYTREGPLLGIHAPPEPGQYELRYVLADGSKTLATRMIEVTPVEVSLGAPDALVVGAGVPIDWTGPDYPNDFIAVVEPGKKVWITSERTAQGAPLTVRMPADPGEYELVYAFGHGHHVVAREPISVAAVQASISAPEGLVAGQTVAVEWKGPDYQNDFVAVMPRDEERALTYSYTRDGSPLQLTMPPEPGEYDITYVMSQDRKVLARVPVSVGAVRASLTPPAELPAGATVEVGWTGPGYQNDFIAVSEPGEDKWINYTYTREGSPLGLTLPPEPGDYDILYILSQGRVVLSRVPITVTGVNFGLTVPDAAPAGSDIEVAWKGPDYRNDFISVAEIDSDDGKYRGYTYTREGSPLKLKMPLEPGRYEIRYVLSQDRKVEARAEIEVTPVSAELKAPDAADVGGSVEVSWQGPAYQNDYIAITPAEEDELKYDRYTYTREGSPLELQLPSSPGDYVLRYVAAGNPKRVLASRPITLTDVSAALKAPAVAEAGGKISVDWQGPGNRNDYIAIGKSGERHVSYAYTRSGNPAVMNVPKEPGDYELRYILHSDTRVIATVPLKVE